MHTSAHRRFRRIRTQIIATFILPALWLFSGASPAAVQDAKSDRKQAVVSVEGMQCPFCAYGIQKQLKKLRGVTRVDVELDKNQAIVTLAPDAKVTDADIQRAIKKAGFTPGKIAWKSAAPPEKKKTTST